MKYPFAYSVMIWTGYDNDENHYKYESGMSIAESFMGAVRILDEYYGDDLIAIKHLELFSDNTIILLPEHVIHDYAKTDFGFEGETCDARGNLFTTMNQEANANEC